MMPAQSLQAWQDALGYTQQRAADALGVSLATYKRYLVGELPQLVALACAALQAGLQPVGKARAPHRRGKAL